jgi:hypothetical protein
LRGQGRQMLMVDPGIKAGFARFQTRWRDPLLTTLTIMLGIMLFVLAPLHAPGSSNRKISDSL